MRRRPPLAEAERAFNACLPARRADAMWRRMSGSAAAWAALQPSRARTKHGKQSAGLTVQGVSNHAWQRWAGARSPPLAVGVSSLGVTPVGLGTCVYGLAAMVVGGTRGFVLWHFRLVDHSYTMPRDPSPRRNGILI